MQFRALSDQLYRSPRFYAELRRAAVEHLREHADTYSPYVEGDFEDYCRSMANDGSWGDHVTLQVRGSALMLSAFPPDCLFNDTDSSAARDRA